MYKGLQIFYDDRSLFFFIRLLNDGHMTSTVIFKVIDIGYNTLSADLG